MRLLLLLALAGVCSGQHRLHAVGVTTRDWVVGKPLLPGGLFVKADGGEWRNPGHRHPYMMGLAWLAEAPGTLFAAAGNGVIRITPDGRWRILTGSDVTELRDISAGAGGALVFGHTAGLRMSLDRGETWKELSAGLHRKYVNAVRADRTKAGRIVAGTEEGLFVSEDGGGKWAPAGAMGFQAMHIEQSPHDGRVWLAVTEQGGLFRSGDGGRTFENAGNVGVGRNLYDIAFDATDAKRIAVGGWGPGVQVSEDGGKTWAARNAGLPRPDVWSLAFDPDHAGRLYAAVHEEAVYVSEDAGRTWKEDGLKGSIVYRMFFVPAGGAQ